MKRTSVAFLLVLVFVVLGCKNCRDKKTGGQWPPNPNARIAPFDTTADMVFMVKPDSSPARAIEFLRENHKFPSENAIVSYCSECDSTIFTVKGLTWTVFGTTGPPPPDRPKGESGACGDWGPLLYSVNYRISTPEPVDTGRGALFDSFPGVFDSSILPKVGNKSDTVLVGVLDTGLDSWIAANYKPFSIANSCIKGAEKGWNFVDSNGDFRDNYGFKPEINGYVAHGTPVTKFIIEQVRTTPTVLKILPVKILDQHGQSDLYRVMCGLAYAKKAGVKIINASFGFYAPASDQVELFKNFVDKITRDGVLIVAAAGNTIDEEDKAAVKDGMAESDLRNLDKHLFFPAAFSETNPKVITVTTISAESIQPTVVVNMQNFSYSKVQVGVFADQERYFREPSKFSKRSREGASFAAPIVTGIIAAHYNSMLKDAGANSLNQQFILNWLKKKNYLTETANAQKTIPQFSARRNQPLPQ